jgi:hypothetical protein
LGNGLGYIFGAGRRFGVAHHTCLNPTARARLNFSRLGRAFARSFFIVPNLPNADPTAQPLLERPVDFSSESYNKHLYINVLMLLDIFTEKSHAPHQTAPQNLYYLIFL